MPKITEKNRQPQGLSPKIWIPATIKSLARGGCSSLGLVVFDDIIGVLDVMGFVQNMIIGVGDDAEMQKEGDDNQKAEPEMFVFTYGY